MCATDARIFRPEGHHTGTESEEKMKQTLCMFGVRTFDGIANQADFYRFHDTTLSNSTMGQGEEDETVGGSKEGEEGSRLRNASTGGHGSDRCERRSQDSISRGR